VKPERVIYASEIFGFFRKQRSVLFRAAAICFALTFLIVLAISKPHYRATATFAQAPSQEEEFSSLRSVLKSMQGGGEGASAAGVMHSRHLLGEVVQEMGLQVERVDQPRVPALLKRELGGNPQSDRFVFRSVSYPEEKGLPFFITSLKGDKFEVRSAKKKLLCLGELGVPVSMESGSFTLTQLGKVKKRVAFVLHPERGAIQNLKKQLKIKVSKVDPTLLHLQYLGPNRETALGVLDTLMESFQSYLQKQHEELASSQIAYLRKREAELSQEFDQSLEEHARYLKEARTPEGFFGLCEEIEMLGQPKERYANRKHELDLQGKSWERDQLEARAVHPWTEGLEKRDDLDWQKAQWGPASAITPAEFSGLDLETAQQLYENTTKERDQFFACLREVEAIKKQLEDPSFSLSGLFQVLTDPASQKIIQQGTTLSFQIADHQNRTSKEIDRLRNALLEQRTLLSNHLSQKIDLLQLQVDLTERKMVALQGAASHLIGKEQELVDQKLEELAEKMGELPEKWQRESQLKFKRELVMQILEGLTTLSEGKVVNHHLFHIASKPLDLADAPTRIEKPRLFAFASMGGLVGGCVFFVLSLLRALYRGFPVSKEYLEDRGYTVLIDGEIADLEKLKQICFRVEPGEVVALFGSKMGSSLANLCAENHLSTLRVEVGRDEERQVFENHHLISVKTLLDRELKNRLASWKTEFSCILFEIDSLDSAEALALAALADRSIVSVAGKSESVLTPFNRENTLCLL